MSDVYQAPQASLNEPLATGQYGSVEAALAGNYELKPVEVIKNAWTNLSGMKGIFWGASAIYILIAILFAFLPVLVFGSAEPGANASSSELIFFYVLQLVQAVVLMPVLMGIVMIAIKHSVGAKVEVGEVFKHFNKTIPLFITYLLMMVTLVIGFILLVLPGIYLLVAYTMAMPLVVDKDMGPWEALNTSRKAITKKWFNMAGFGMLTILVLLAGTVALLVGLVWAYPLIALAYAIIYRDMFGVEEKTLNS